jgi:hypothetical protein
MELAAAPSRSVLSILILHCTTNGAVAVVVVKEKPHPDVGHVLALLRGLGWLWPGSGLDRHRLLSVKNHLDPFFLSSLQLLSLLSLEHWTHWRDDGYSIRHPYIAVIMNQPTLASIATSPLLRKCFSLANILLLYWLYTVYSSERSQFSRSISQCDWSQWDQQVPGSNPHRVVLVADPQLVDPHTYPGRPWPLSSLTVRYTDLYLRRVYRLLQHELYPDTTIFLGDLFDGGREWATGSSTSPEKRYQKYGDSFWLKEYKRFSSLFFDPWIDAGIAARPGQGGRRQLLTNLPGNHDLGFASGIQLPVRQRFHTYFGESNRIDIIGNHSFISLDSVSLSARDVEDGQEEVWRPAEAFLNNFNRQMHATVARHVRLDQGLHSAKLYEHRVFDTNELASTSLPRLGGSDIGLFPNVLLTHVPLYRDPGTPCGVQREHWPPTLGPNGEAPEKDDRNAITVARGYQYQNVLSMEISKEIATKIGNLSYAFSGDDHDYCHVVHRRFPSAGSGIDETTVKSLSWAMGIRKPGFLMLSLWNPIAPEDASLRPDVTMNSHLCLMPDQLGIFIHYAVTLAFTLSALAIRAAYLTFNPSKSPYSADGASVLPVSRPPNHETEKAASSSSDDGFLSGPSSRRATLQARQPNNRARSASPRKSLGYGLPPSSNLPSQKYSINPGSAFFQQSSSAFREKAFLVGMGENTRKLKGLALFWMEFRWSIYPIALVVLPFYLWLVWHG